MSSASRIAASWGVLGALLGACERPAAAQTSAVSADFGVHVDYPLLKTKFNLYNTALPSRDAFVRDAPLLRALDIESMRVEQTWGFNQALSHTVGGSRDHLTYDWALSDEYQQLAADNGVLLHWSYDYCPYPLCSDSRDVPPSPQWESVVTTAAQHFREGKTPVVYEGVWNEPDFQQVHPEWSSFGQHWFFNGDLNAYLDLYNRTATALRATNPDAKIGGPTTAFWDWVPTFAAYTSKNGLPVDFVSYHQYTSFSPDHSDHVRDALAANHYFDKSEMVMDEYNHFNPWPRGGAQDKAGAAVEMLHDFTDFLKRPEITSINWAQFQEPCDCDQFIGIVTLDGHRKAAYNGLALYGWMPVDRSGVDASGGLDAFASAESHRAGLIVSNRTGASKDYQVTLHHLPFANGMVKVFPIDPGHNSFLDGANEVLTPTATQPNVAADGWTWKGTLANETLVAFQIEDGSGISLAQPNAVARVVRVNRYYPHRGTPSYADFDRKTWIARLGMAGDAAADQEVGVTAEKLPAALHFLVTADGPLVASDANSLFGIRIDYLGDAGRYTRGILFHGKIAGQDVYRSERTAVMPFGTEKAPDQTVAVADFSDFVVPLAERAPPGWTGRVQITFILQNAGAQARAVVRTLACATSDCASGSPGDGGSSDSNGPGEIVGAGGHGNAGSDGDVIIQGDGGHAPPSSSAGGDVMPAASVASHDATSGCACSIGENVATRGEDCGLVVGLAGLIVGLGRRTARRRSCTPEQLQARRRPT